MQHITNQACAKLYKRTLFDCIKYPIGMHYEDVATTFKLYDKAIKVSHTEKGLYCYRVREGTITYHIRTKDILDLWNASLIIKKHYSNPSSEQMYYEMTVLYTIYSRLLRSECSKDEIKEYEKKIYSELRGIQVNINKFKGKSPMFWKLKLFRLHLIKFVIKVIDVKRKYIHNKDTYSHC